MMNYGSLPGVLLLVLLAGCTSTNTKPETACEGGSAGELEGEYVNVGSEKMPDGLDLFLAEILWASDFETDQELHSSIDRIALGFDDQGQLQATGYSGSDVLKEGPVDETIELQENVVLIGSESGFWDGAPGGVVVGPHSYEFEMFLNCERNLVAHIDASVVGLAYLLIPVAGTDHFYSTFKRIGE